MLYLAYHPNLSNLKANLSVSKTMPFLGITFKTVLDTDAWKNLIPPPVFDEKGIRLEFAQFGHFDSFEVFRSLTSMAALADHELPAPIATGLKTMRFMDTVDLRNVLDRDLYYRVRVKRGNEVMLSDELHAFISTFDAPQNVSAAYANGALQIEWDFQSVENCRYYCSETEIDPLNLPAPKAVLAGDVRTYTDISIEAGKTYYVRLGSVRNNIEKLSGEVSVDTFDNPVLSLFKNSGKGFWFDFNDMSSMYQDSAGTIPVSAFSQLIGKVLDKSGNGNHAVQTYSVNSPVLNPNGAYFNGANNSLRTINEVNYDGSENVEIFVKIESLYRSNKAYFCVFESGNTFNQKTGGFIALAREENYTITGGISISTNSAQNVTHLYRGPFLTYDGIFSISATDTECIMHVVADDVVLRKSKPAGIQISNNFLNIGARYNNNDLHYYGYIKQIVCVNRILTAVERSNLIAFMNAN
ncbi:hypothetical protein D7V68_02505 [Acinetobacter cumulans]|uniref:hypothetical protein n=1 Tax=Acinetobacter cumulans TaxID=2136182 RepID=UPI000EA12F8A|nr:hypothetical protein [Acinetobacter cumulans]RKG50796.1 hypothetical protein D7V68_02505 [Acinetobacter cumulans]